MELLGRLARSNVDIVTIGQYLRPSRENLPVEEYVPPEVFDALPRGRRGMGFRHVFSGPFVRSSYRPKRRSPSRERRRRDPELAAGRTPASSTERPARDPAAHSRRRLSAPASSLRWPFPRSSGFVLLPLALVAWLVALAREESPTARSLLGCPVRARLLVRVDSMDRLRRDALRRAGRLHGDRLPCCSSRRSWREWPALVAWGTVAAMPAGLAWRLRGLPGSLDGVRARCGPSSTAGFPGT